MISIKKTLVIINNAISINNIYTIFIGSAVVLYASLVILAVSISIANNFLYFIMLIGIAIIFPFSFIALCYALAGIVDFIFMIIRIILLFFMVSAWNPPAYPSRGYVQIDENDDKNKE